LHKEDMNQPEHKTINILSEFYTILEETKVVLENRLLRLYKVVPEPDPDSITFSWNSSLLKEEDKPETTVLVKPKVTVKEKNFACKLCSQKMAGVPNYKREGQLPILVLHYTGEIRKGQPQFVRKGKTLIFRTTEIEDLFARMIQKSMGFDYKSMYFQEFPACTFNHNHSTDIEWKNRMDNCTMFVKETIEEHKIQAVIMIGAAAVLFYGKEEAKKMADQLLDFNFLGTKIKGIVLRSPDAILALETKKKSLADDKESADYKKVVEEEKNIKIQIVEQLQKLKLELKV
jgi:hypothetical protein